MDVTSYLLPEISVRDVDGLNRQYDAYAKRLASIRQARERSNSTWAYKFWTNTEKALTTRYKYHYGSYS
jgi:hypothetical protein